MSFVSKHLSSFLVFRFQGLYLPFRLEYKIISLCRPCKQSPQHRCIRHRRIINQHFTATIRSRPTSSTRRAVRHCGCRYPTPSYNRSVNPTPSGFKPPHLPAASRRRPRGNPRLPRPTPCCPRQLGSPHFTLGQYTPLVPQSCPPRTSDPASCQRRTRGNPHWPRLSIPVPQNRIASSNSRIIISELSEPPRRSLLPRGRQPGRAAGK